MVNRQFREINIIVKKYAAHGCQPINQERLISLNYTQHSRNGDGTQGIRLVHRTAVNEKAIFNDNNKILVCNSESDSHANKNINAMSIKYKNSNIINLDQNNINIKIACRDVQCLIDSGSMICAIKSSFFRNLPQEIKNKAQRSDIDQLTLVNNQSMSIKSKVRLVFTINKVDDQTTFYILDRANEGVIL